MKLSDFYKIVVGSGINADVRSWKEIKGYLAERKREYDLLPKVQQEYFDPEFLINPFSDTRILYGDPKSDIKSIIVGIDIDGSELLVVDRLKEKGKKIDLVVAHHPQGKAYASFYEVMDLQIDVFAQEGVSLSVSENLVKERQLEVARKVNAANHSRSVDVARLLNLNFLCMHTPCDNLAHQYIKRIINKFSPKTLGKIVDILCGIPEYRYAAQNNNSPIIAVGSSSSRCSKIHFEFTGGTEGPERIYKRLSACGVDTIIAMHQSEERVKKCKELNINVIFASHIASDSLGINIMLDILENQEKLSIYEFSGFKRFSRKLKR